MKSLDVHEMSDKLEENLIVDENDKMQSPHEVELFVK
jgi:hypothetical protein